MLPAVRRAIPDDSSCAHAAKVPAQGNGPLVAALGPARQKRGPLAESPDVSFDALDG